MKTVEIEGKTYELKYNMKRIEMIESVTGMPTLADLKRNSGMLSISSLKTYFAYALKEQGADVFVQPKKGLEMCEALIENEGYEKVCYLVLEAIQEGCPFFFPKG